MKKPAPPTTIPELLQRVEAIAGLTLGELAEQYHFKSPDDLLREKGWPGQLIEYVLGASAGSKPVPDFEHIGVELKTIPLSYTGKPLETTYVSVVPLTNLTGLTWHNSSVKKKLNHVLWLPILAERDIAPVDRTIGSGFLWQPNATQEAQLQRDWEEQIELIALGRVDEISGHLGEVMQIRPKAANSKALTDAIGPQGGLIKTLPRGFYLKTQFTQNILKNHFSY
ncbi:DNA mismatch repair endonuclease MutH [Pseudoalteromonas luteoviolacea]|uniref:DNA mismatch repair protein MutH n=1 Tax=Pseudoalteromonas luteoviolacea S4054 TaxID=1129367 RepID=A0A0F6AAE1_9GAMM|nr:DNA mismatch repair endonuclease MutH [Pseudoalteromonas luteoviolacea]AOT09405.1 DNA mismatch repair protein MutH [Pseudoalteromonas luteoviolacea]AOT14317.1 DNA mismatch repair protein MutH [Pseudoalteromonas luteoviolacea]AOT19233.1 DNA mismatch repair protein MutH [Pseudoalteromonas luteoviolacea]KKE83118.1 DNA mismatch repair protein [Pseudoalteromonas luteoviolacea S4054]KZN73509.1 DNA mismatch repair protein [Pseudoalteromonas luteoviolacea S4047-1]